MASVFGEILLTERYDVDETAPGEIIPTTMPKETYSAFRHTSLPPSVSTERRITQKLRLVVSMHTDLTLISLYRVSRSAEPVT